MIEPEALADLFSEVAILLRTQGAVLHRSQGELTWRRVGDWEDAKMPRPVEPLSDEQDERARAGRSEDDETRRRDEAAAARYRSELATLTARQVADLGRLKALIAICNPQKPKALQRSDRTAAQVIAEGSCPSCWRIGEDVAITLRPSRVPGESGAPWYKDRCKPCGDWRSEYGQDKPLPILRKHAQGRRVTTADVAKALGRTG